MFLRFIILITILTVFCGCDKTTPAPAPEPVVRTIYVLPPPRMPKYRVHSSNPLFGKPFNFDRAVSGKIQELPASGHAANGILVDVDTHQVLWEKDSMMPTPIASLSKLMTIYLAMEKLEVIDKPDLESVVTVSSESCQVGPVKANLKPGEKIQLKTLMALLMVRSANDAARQVAEFFGDGYERNFVVAMNEKAREIGMTTARFVNPNGLPIYRNDHPPLMNVCSVYDLVRLSERITEYPQIMDLTALRQFEFRPGVTFNNTNHLLSNTPGTDGFKTGFTQAAGHCLAFSSVRNGHRLIGVVTGFNKRPECFQFSRDVLEWGFNRIGGQ